MKKFEGKLNGQVFDNKEEFMAALNHALISNQNISTSFSIEEANEVPEKSSELKAQKKYLPNVDEILDKTYVDNILSMEDPGQGIENIVNNLNEYEGLIIEAIPHNTNEQLEVYLKAVGDVIAILDEDIDQTDAALTSLEDQHEKYEVQIAKIQAQMKDTESKIEILNNAYQIIDNYYDFYAEIQDRDVKELERRSMKHECTCGCDDECTCTCSGKCDCGDECKCHKPKNPTLFDLFAQLGVN
jgi:chaperonin cofactor prefoldin